MIPGCSVAEGAPGVAGGAWSVGTGAGGGGAGADSAGVPSPTDFRPVFQLGIANRNAIKKKTMAAPIVIFAMTVAVPRGPKAEELAPPPNTAAASDLPGCSNTNKIKTKHATMYNVISR